MKQQAEEESFEVKNMSVSCRAKQREPEDSPRSPSPSYSGSEDSSFAEISILGVSTANKGDPVWVRVAGAHGSDQFLVLVDEIGLSQAAGAPAGDSGDSVIIGGGRAFRVGVHWIYDDDAEDDGDAKEWKEVSELGNGGKFCDEDGDLDPDTAGIPQDAWQMAYGKIIAPLPGGGT